MIAPAVDLTWWHAHRDDVVLADVRWYLDGRSGVLAYEAGHLPGAVFVDLERWLAGPPSVAQGRHPLPDPEVFARGMTAVGITDPDTVLAYDDEGGVIAARLVWLLRATGHRAALLDGGLACYEGELEIGGPPTLAPPADAGRGGRPPFRMSTWPAELLADLPAVTDPAAVVLDARSGERYRGEHEPVDAQAGHIPGARSLPCRSNLDAAGRLLPPAELRRRFEAAGVTPDADVVAYCGSGVTACHTLLTLELTGLGPGRLYPGSWSQYARTGRPVATGSGGAGA